MHDDELDDVMDIDDALVEGEEKVEPEIPTGFSEVDPITGLPILPDDVPDNDGEEEDAVTEF